MDAPQPEDDVRDLRLWITKYGLPAVLLCWIVYVGVTRLVEDVHATRMALDAHIEATREVQVRIEAILRQSCVNTASDALQRQACWSAGYK